MPETKSSNGVLSPRLFFSQSDACASLQPPSCSRHGSSSISHIRTNEILHGWRETTSRFPSSKILARLESRRESLDHLKHQELMRHQAKIKHELTTLTRRKLQSMANRPGLMRGIFFRCCVAELFGWAIFTLIPSSRPRSALPALSHSLAEIFAGCVLDRISIKRFPLKSEGTQEPF